MEYSLILTFLLSLTLTKSLADVSSLQDYTQDHLDPLQDQDQDLTTNNQEKRTICAALNKCGSSSVPTSTYVKRLVIKGGLKHVSYAPLVRPVGVRPVVIGGYRYPKPRIHFRLKPPSTIQGGWKPMAVPSKPVVEVKPSNHVDVIRPVPHVDHVAPVHLHPQNVALPAHFDHVHLQQNHVHLQAAQPTFVHLKPLGAPLGHLDQVHQINLQHGNHFDSFTHVDHLHPNAVPVVQPVVPVTPPPTIVKPFAPSPVLFEVTKPNLGVLPLGARFPSPILKEVPHVHLGHVATAVPIAPPAVVHDNPGHHHHHPAVQGIIHTHAGLPHIAPQPGVSVEYHGTRNFVPFSGALPISHQTPVSAVQHLPHQHLAHAFAHQQALPYEHAAHGFVAPQQALPHDHAAHGFAAYQQVLPFDHAAHGFAAPQQALPLEHAAHGFATSQQALPFDHAAHAFAASQQALPHEHAEQFQQQFNPHFHQQLQAIQQYQDIPQGQLPLETEKQQQQNLNHLQDSNELNIQNFDQSNVIQPGQTDVQIPYHLPQHGGWEAAQQEESRGFGDQVFRPSQQLEAPYVK